MSSRERMGAGRGEREGIFFLSSPPAEIKIGVASSSEDELVEYD